MQDANLYERSNTIQKRDALACLTKYAPKLKWKKKDNRIIDLGSGDGAVTNMLMTFFPSDFKLLGVDISENMVNHANKHHKNEKTSFSVLDIAGDLPNSMKGHFDHVFSFYTVHWIKNQELAFRNIYDLLEQNGECLVTLLAFNIIYEAWRALSKRSKWSTLLQNVEKFVSPYEDSEEPEKEALELMKKIGFVNIDVECKTLSYSFDNMDELRDHLAVINPFKIPTNQVGEFLEDCIQVLKDDQIKYEVSQPKEPYKYVTIYYKLLIVYGQKPESEN